MEKKTILLIVRMAVLIILTVAAGFLYGYKAKEAKVAAVAEAASVSRYFDNQGVIVEGVLEGVNSVSVKYYPGGAEESRALLQSIIRQGTYDAEAYLGAVVYEIRMLNEEGESIEPGETVNCYITLSEEMKKLNGNTYVIYRMDGTSAVEQTAFLKGSDLVLMTDQGGIYVVVKMRQTIAEKEEKSASENTPAEQDAEIAAVIISAQTDRTAPTPTPRPTSTPAPQQTVSAEIPEEAPQVSDEERNERVPENVPEVVPAENIQGEEPAEQPTVPEEAAVHVNHYYATRKVNVRSGMSTDDAIITTLAPNTPIDVIRVEEGSEWALVNVNGQMGYVNIQFIGVN